MIEDTALYVLKPAVWKLVALKFLVSLRKDALRTKLIILYVSEKIKALCHSNLILNIKDSPDESVEGKLEGKAEMLFRALLEMWRNILEGSKQSLWSLNISIFTFWCSLYRSHFSYKHIVLNL